MILQIVKRTWNIGFDSVYLHCRNVIEGNGEMKRVVVTGTGVISPIGNTTETFWENLKKKTVGIGRIDRFDTEKYKTKLAAQVK